LQWRKIFEGPACQSEEGKNHRKRRAVKGGPFMSKEAGRESRPWDIKGGQLYHEVTGTLFWGAEKKKKKKGRKKKKKKKKKQFNRVGNEES